MSTKSRVVICALSAIVLIVYVCLGSLLFIAVEQGGEEDNTNKKIQTIEKLIKNVESLRNFKNNSVDRNFDDEEYIGLLNDTYTATLELLRAERLSHLPWNFFTGIHFCLTAITTIGYGYITPVSQLGRGLCILYVVIGIPINIFFSAKLAYFIAQGITKLYILCAKFTKVLLCKNCSQGNPDQTNVYEMDVTGEFSQGVDRQDDLRGKGGSIQHINVAFNTADGTLSPNSEVDILPESRRFGRSNGTDLVSHTSPSIDGTENTCNEALSESEQSERTLIPVWFMFVLLVAFCSLASFLLYLEENGNWTFLDSFYYVIITFTTVGFGDISFQTSDDVKDSEAFWFKTFFFYALMEIGLVVMTTFITLFADSFQQSVKRAKTSFRSSGP